MNALVTFTLIISSVALILSVVSVRVAYRNKQVTMFVPKTDQNTGEKHVCSFDDPHCCTKYVCTHDDPLCKKYGCPDDPGWIGDRR